jgi:hypothetical protein
VIVDYQTEASAWDRRGGEPTKAYAAFRIYRDLAPTQRTLAAVAERSGFSERRCRYLASTWDWRERADEWDDECHQIEDRERLELIRSMHATHRRAGRAAVVKAIQALQKMQADDLTPGQAARLLELGAKLERTTLLVSVEELQGLDTFDEEDEEDPWERIARELDPNRGDPAEL